MRGVRRWLGLVDAGADPIEALHGHVCSTRCWHYALGGEEQRERIRRIRRP